jgi:hypothetical protein
MARDLRMLTTTWQGRRGSVLLGPTEHRVAVYLADLTSRGRVVVRTVDLMARLHLERSEAYRVTARLRVLGVFGIRNDQGGTLGGRWYWRTAIKHDGARLDPARHRVAWARVLGGARARRARIIELLASATIPQTPPGPRWPDASPHPAGASFRDRFAAAGGSSLLASWGVRP